jgi:hypothetical protein
VGTTRKVLGDSLFLAGTEANPVLGLNFAEVGLSVTRNKVALIPLKTPDQVELDFNNDGIWDDVFFGLEMFAPAFMPLGYGQKTLAARVTYSDGSTASAVTTYDSLPMEAVSNGGSIELQVGGTAAADSATVTKLPDGSYRVDLAGQTRDFQDIDNVAVRLSQSDDTLILAGGTTIDLSSVLGVEKIDLTATTAETVNSIDSIMVENQVGFGGTLLIKAGAEDTLEILPGWVIQAPQIIDGRATAKLAASDTTLLIQTGNFTNPVNNLDVTFDGFVTARDALLVINHLNQASAGTTPTIEAYLDVNNNGTISALDVLLVINDINNRPSGEGEATQAVTLAIAAPLSQAAPLDGFDIEAIRRRTRP